MSVLLKTQATPVTIRGEKLDYLLPLNTENQSMENFKKFEATECPNKECILRE